MISKEIFFWSGIMRDHANFLFSALSPNESYYIKMAKHFKNEFINLRQEAQQLNNMHMCPQHMALIDKAIPLVLNFINYKRKIVKKLLECDIQISFPPTFVNHMINEALEFLRVLDKLKNNHSLDSADEIIHLHKVWLRDASGHAAAIASDLDPTEESLIKEALDFKECLNNLYIKSVELGNMLQRTNLTNSSLKGLNNQVEKKDERIYKISL